MATFITTLTADYILEAALVGIAFFAVAGRYSAVANSKAALLLLTCIFALLSAYYLPALHALDASVKVGNAEIAEMLDLPGEFTQLKDLLTIGWFDVLVWLMQATIAYYVGRYVLGRAMKRAVVGSAAPDKRGD